METKHWFGMALVLALVWLAASKYPSYGQSALSKVGLS